MPVNSELTGDQRASTAHEASGADFLSSELDADGVPTKEGVEARRVRKGWPKEGVGYGTKPDVPKNEFKSQDPRDEDYGKSIK